jgi:hypothetical protein
LVAKFRERKFRLKYDLYTPREMVGEFDNSD